MNPSSSPSGAVSAQCSANPTCASLGINGQCCPTSAGVQLDCCDQATSTTPTSPPTRNPSSSPSKNPTSPPTTSPNSSSPSQSPIASSGPAQCSATPGCASLGLEGECCPTSTGVQLDCCDQAASTTPTSPPTTNPSSPAPTIQPECSANQECLGLGLTGLCCPTTDDVMASILGLIYKKLAFISF
jgi:hypothetical protein